MSVMTKPSTRPTAFPPWMLRIQLEITRCPNCFIYQWESGEENPDEPLLRCSKCKYVRYCGVDCQREHWKKQHMKQCRKMRAGPQMSKQIEEAYAAWDGETIMRLEKVTSVSDPHWGCLLGPLSSIIEIKPDEIGSREELIKIKLPFALGEQTGKFTSRYEQTLSLMQRVLHKMYLTSHPLVADDDRLRSLFRYIGILRMQLFDLAMQMPSGQILEYFHQDQIGQNFHDDEVGDHLMKLVNQMSKESSSVENMIDASPYNHWKTFEILIFFCLHITHADRVLFEELGENVEDESIATALSKGETSEKFNVKQVAVLEGLQNGLMPFTDLLNILCDGNQHKTCDACKSSIYVEGIVFHNQTKLPPKPFLLCIFGSSAFCCSRTSCFKTVSEKTWILANTLMVTYHHFALKYTPNRCDMCFKFSKKVHRCDRCRTKVYCSEQCRDQDWNLIHKDICKKEQDGKKVKGGVKRRSKVGKEMMKNYIKDLGLGESCEGLTESAEPNLKETVRISVQNTSKKLTKQLK